MDDSQLNALIESVMKEIATAKANDSPSPFAAAPAANSKTKDEGRLAELRIDLSDPTVESIRYQPAVKNAKDPEALKALIASTSARLGVGRAGPRYTTKAQLLFQSDHAITQDALYRDVEQKLLGDLNLFTVQTKVAGGKQEYLLRPDLGRQLNDEAKKVISDKCVKSPNIQLVIGDGLSAAAVEANVREMFPVIMQGAKANNLTLGTPFFVKYCRVGVMNDIGDLIKPEVLILLIGERPGLGRAESLSAYMAFRPKAGDSDADRDVVCNIFNNGGTNPLEGAAFTIQIAQKMMKHGASGVKLKLEDRG